MMRDLRAKRGIGVDDRERAQDRARAAAPSRDVHHRKSGAAADEPDVELAGVARPTRWPSVRRREVQARLGPRVAVLA